MKIENLLPCDMFFPYAGVSVNRGVDIKAGKLSQEIESTRYFNPLLQRDMIAGRIKIHLNDMDKSILHMYASEVSAQAQKIADIKPIPIAPIAKKEVKDIPVEKPAVVATPVKPAPAKFEKEARPPVVEIAKVEDKSLAELNAEKEAEINKAKMIEQGKPVFPSLKEQSNKAKLGDISAHMKDIV